MITRRGGCAGCSVPFSVSDVIPVPGARAVFQWNHRYDLSSFALVAGDRALAVQQRDALLHTEQPDSLARSSASPAAICVESSSPIPYLQPDMAIVRPQHDCHPRAARVLADVCERLLGYSVEGCLDLRW